MSQNEGVVIKRGVGGGGGLDLLENSLIWLGHSKMLLMVKNLKKCNLTVIKN